MKRSLLITFWILTLAFFAGCADSGSDNGPGNTDGDDTTDDDDDDDDNGGDDFLSADTGSVGGRDGNYDDDDDASEDADDDDAGDDDDDGGREIAESDLFKVVGDKIYTLHHYKGLAVVDYAQPSNPRVVGRLRMAGTPMEMYVDNGVATILVTNVYQQEEGTSRVRYASKIVTADVTDPTNPTLIREFYMGGNMVDNRQVGKIVYVVSTVYPWWDYCNDNSTDVGTVEIKSIDVSDPDNVAEVDAISFEGSGYAVYVSQNALYVADSGYDYYDGENDYHSEIRYIDISDPNGDMVQRGTFHATGMVQDRFKMYQTGNVFAVVSADYWGNSDTVLETFDITNPDAITRLGNVTVMENEQLHATNFSGTRAYIVTYRQTDPLFVVDFADAAEPTVLGELIIPGWSTHLEVRGTKLFGVGIDDTDNWKTKVGYFDVTDPTNPTELGSVSLGEGYSWSEATSDWKAFKVYDDLNLILVPTQEYSSDWGTYVNKLNLLDFDDTTLSQRGSVLSESQVRRGFVAGEYLGLLSETHLMIIDPADRDNPAILGKARLAGYVENLQRCKDMLCNTGEFYTDYAYRLRLFDPQNIGSEEPSWQSQVLDNSLGGWYGNHARVINHGNKVYLVEDNYGYYWGEEDWDKSSKDNDGPRRLIHAFDLTNSASPSYLGSGAMPLEEDSYWSGLNQAKTLTDSGALAATEEAYVSNDWRFVLKVYDVNDLDNIETDVVEDDLRPLMGYNFRSDPIINGNHVWVPTCEPVSGNGDMPLARCFALKVDASDPSSASRAAKVNIPGHLIGVNEAENRLYAVNRTFGEETVEEGYGWRWSYVACDYTLEVLSLEGGRARRVNTLDLYTDPYCYYTSEEYLGDDDDDDDDYDYPDGVDDDDDVAVEPDGEATDGTERKAGIRKARKVQEAQWQTYLSDIRIEDNTIVTILSQYNYNNGSWDEDTCSYNYNSEYQSLVKIIDGQSGTVRTEEAIPGSYNANWVDGGGVLATAYQYSQVETTYTYTFVDLDGTREDFTLPTSNSGYWWYYSNSGVRLGDTLYIPMGWEGIYTHELGR